MILFFLVKHHWIMRMLYRPFLICFAGAFEKKSAVTNLIFFSKNVGWQVRQQLSDGLGIATTKYLGKYLGVPIIHDRASRNTYQFIFDKVNQRPNAWKSIILSLFLVGSHSPICASGAITYVMQSILLLCDDINRTCRRCVCVGWGGDNDNDYICWRLGIRRMCDINQAFMMREGWRLFQHEQCLLQHN